MRSEGVEKAERYSSGGLVSGVVAMVAVVAVLAHGLLSEDAGLEPWVYPGLLLAGVLVWAVLIRPAVVLHPEEVELRNVLHSRWIPFSRMTSVAIQQVTVIEVGEDRFVGSGFGRARPAINRDAQVAPDAPSTQRSLGRLVEEKVQRRMAAAESVEEPAAVRRTWAVPEIVALGALTVATLVTALVA